MSLAIALGRGVEGGGEDVLLAIYSLPTGSRLPGQRLRPTADAGVHQAFRPYGAGEAGLDYNTVDFRANAARSYLPPFKRV